MSFVLTLVIGIPVILISVVVVDRGGEYFYLYVWLLYAGLALAMISIIPNYIMPLFNTFTKLRDGSLRTKIETLASSIKFPLTKIFVVDGSKRSHHSNAYMFGFGKDRRIVLYDTLLKQMDNDEVRTGDTCVDGSLFS